MISVLLIWIYMLLTVFPLGYLGLYGLISDKKQINRLIPEDFVMFGLMAVTVYAQFFSLFAGVGLAANIILLAASLAAAVFGFKSFKVSFSERLSFKPVLILVLLVSALIMAFGASRGYMHYDSDLYHAQSIHWIEDYGVVKGLGNLYERLAYNSSAFALCALYSFRFLGGQSFHACAGFIVLIVFICCLRLFRIIKDKKIRVSDFARLGALYYIFNIFDEMVSPASDYFIMLFFLYSVIRLLDFGEIEEIDEDLIAFPSLLAVFLITLKISAAGMLIILILPVALLIKKKRFGKLFAYMGLSIVIVLPFLIRNYLLSGWLLFPVTVIDIFDPVWKYPRLLAAFDSDQIIAFGRGYSDYRTAKFPLTEWFPHWIKTLNKTDLLLFFSSVLGIISFIPGLFLKKKQAVLHLTELSVITTFLLWFFSAPLIRYGQGFIIMLPAVMAGDYVSFIHKKTNHSKWLTFSCFAFICLFMCYKSIMLGKYSASKFYLPYWITQQDYTDYEVVEYRLNDTVIYCPKSNDRIGYYPFPAAVEPPLKVDMIGPDIKDGFRFK